MYKYDLHVHTNVGSLCALSTPEEMVEAYFKAGYNGFVITDHFIRGNTGVPRDIPWKDRIEMYFSAYERAKAKAEELGDFTVFFGAEYCYVWGHEILIYGADKDFLLKHPEIEGNEPEKICEIFRKGGFLTVKPHPYRVRFYTDTSVPAELYCVDGIEVHNSCNFEEENQKALEFAKKTGKIMTSGGDIHDCLDKRIGTAGIATKKPIKSNKELVKILKSGNYTLITE